MLTNQKLKEMIDKYLARDPPPVPMIAPEESSSLWYVDSHLYGTGIYKERIQKLIDGREETTR